VTLPRSMFSRAICSGCQTCRGRTSLGRPGRTGGRGRGHAGRQRATREPRTRRSRTGEEQIGITERSNRAHAKLRAPGERANAQAQELADPPQAPLLPLARRATRQGHPRPGDPCGLTRMKKGSLPYALSASQLSEPPGVSASQLSKVLVRGLNAASVIETFRIRWLSRSCGVLCVPQVSSVSGWPAANLIETFR
jgi:hypothetical protein